MKNKWTKYQPSIQLFHTKAPHNTIYIFKPVMHLYGILLKAIISQMHFSFFFFFFFMIISAGKSHK